ncbi:hypothetical protein RDWZM_006075 [Blomia tropicalis]|uniref:CUB domain-containing protein n=1 Tax=Blomia tropicalis TaxID=40697 RepID=A0A9Q0M5C3_BLOTA|nr:hypothetical protein RDWZM_006075 [Blomia tropicalis]
MKCEMEKPIIIIYGTIVKSKLELVYAKEFAAKAAFSVDSAVPTAIDRRNAFDAIRLEHVQQSSGNGVVSAGPGIALPDDDFTIRLGPSSPSSPLPSSSFTLSSSSSLLSTATSEVAKANIATKKPKYPSTSLTSKRISTGNVFVRTPGDPSFERQIGDLSADDPCYNFTVGNENAREFYSPGFPNFYPNDTECERVIKAPVGHQIRIEFRDQFHMESATNCEYDYLEIRDGAYGYSTPLGKLCGPEFPSDITSNDRYLFLRFVSDDSIEYQGFRAVYSFIRMKKEKPEPPHDCRFNKSGVSGLIENREIPVELTNYSITQDVSMYLNFKEYKLAVPNNCEANYIDIYGDKLSDLGRKQRFCGTQAEPVRSDGNHMNIRFFAKPDALSQVQFEITFTAFREVSNKEKCFADEFDCEDSTCIAISLKCDNVDNCKYRYDEDKQTTCAPGNQGVLNLNSQHMVVILIVFCALVFGMCASITISCWSKIEERRQRKREYKLRRSREASMEVGLDRTMTITSLDRNTGCVLEHPDQASSSSGSRSRKIITANAIRHKDLVDDDVMEGPALAYYDSEENGCYVPDMEIHTSMHHIPSTSHHPTYVYPPSAERRPKSGAQQSNGGTICAGHHLDSVDKYSPDTPTPPQMMIGSPNGPGGGQSPLVAGEYYPQQNQMERDSIRSGSECSIPPPPPPPALSHFRNRMQQQQQQQTQPQQQAQYRTLPLDASKLPDSGMMILSDNHQTLPYRHPQHMQHGPQRNQMTLSQQQLVLHHPPAQHHPDCAQHKLQQQQQQHPDANYPNQGSMRRGYYNSRPNTANSNRIIVDGNGIDSAVELLNDCDVDDGIIDEGDESGVGPSEHRSAMELADEVLDDDLLTENDIYPSTNGRLQSGGMGPGSGMPHRYLLRGQSTLDEEDDSATSVPLTNSNAGYGSGGQMTPGHRQPYYRSEAVIEMANDGTLTNPNSNGLRQGVAIMR